MAEETLLHPEDIEIEHTPAGPIIHIFPQHNPKKMVKDIMMGIYLFHNTKTYDQITRDKLQGELSELQVKLYKEIRSQSSKDLESAEKYAELFLTKIKYK